MRHYAGGVTTTLTHWISGATYDGTSGRTSPVHNPATGQVTGAVALASEADVEHAVATAREAAAGWRHSSLSQRAGVLFAFREIAQRPHATSSPR